jgi:hypothetical protein
MWTSAASPEPGSIVTVSRGTGAKTQIRGRSAGWRSDTGGIQP